MEQQQTVTVYAFRTFDQHFESPRTASFKATRQVIASIQGELLNGTEEEVERDELDARGCYRRLATGWGELG